MFVSSLMKINFFFMFLDHIFWQGLEIQETININYFNLKNKTRKLDSKAL